MCNRNPYQAANAVAGRGGDGYWLFKNASGKLVLAALRTWDTARHAGEFFEAVRQLRGTRPSTRVTLAEQSRVGWTAASGAGCASLQERQVLLVVAPDEETTK